MSVAELVLDYIQALIWPVLIAGALWVFRRQLEPCSGTSVPCSTGARPRRLSTEA
jgi:hypothetical protein